MSVDDHAPDCDCKLCQMGQRIKGEYPLRRTEDGGSEREDNRIEPLKYQIREWRTKVALKHLPPTDCDRDDPRAVSDLIISLREENKRLRERLDPEYCECAEVKRALATPASMVPVSSMLPPICVRCEKEIKVR